jgi:hypothetical protein
MNKVMTTALIAGGLMLINSPEAAAHEEVRHTHQAPAYYYYPGVDVRRPRHMPRWLHRNHEFRYWYRHTPLRRNLRIAWHELFDIYRWERRHATRFDRRYRDYDDYRRRHYRDDRDGHRNKRHDKRRDERRHRH